MEKPTCTCWVMLPRSAKSHCEGPCRMSPRLSKELPPLGRGGGDGILLATAPCYVTLTLLHRVVRWWLWQWPVSGGLCRAMQQTGSTQVLPGCIYPWEEVGGTAQRLIAPSLLSLTVSMHRDRVPAPIGPNWTSSQCFVIFQPWSGMLPS